MFVEGVNDADPNLPVRNTLHIMRSTRGVVLDTTAFGNLNPTCKNYKSVSVYMSLQSGWGRGKDIQESRQERATTQASKFHP